MDGKDYLELFNYEFLKALSDWQRGWGEVQNKRRELADNLVKVCQSLPDEFKSCDKECFRKRFIVGGEIVPIILEDNFFEGIASWSFDISFAKKFKGLVNPSTKFAMIFKHIPEKEEVVVNICNLWENEFFKKAVENLNEIEPNTAAPLLNFRDLQSEIILKSCLKGSEINHIVGISSSFDEICDMAKIPEEERDELSIKYARDTNGIPISIPMYTNKLVTKKVLDKTIAKMRQMLNEAKKNNIPIYNLEYKAHENDLKHKFKV